MRHPRRKRDEEPTIEDLRRLCADDLARRDLLWLRAQEKEDWESVGSLERADPELRARMTHFMLERGLELHLLEECPSSDRREVFACLWDERLKHLCRTSNNNP